MESTIQWVSPQLGAVHSQIVSFCLPPMSMVCWMQSMLSSSSSAFVPLVVLPIYFTVVTPPSSQYVDSHDHHSLLPGIGSNHHCPHTSLKIFHYPPCLLEYTIPIPPPHQSCIELDSHMVSSIQYWLSVVLLVSTHSTSLVVGYSVE